MTEPRTEAGQKLLSAMGDPDAPQFASMWQLHDAILAVEREAAASPSLDVERWAESLAAAGCEGHPVDLVNLARDAIAEYARLSPTSVIESEAERA